MRPIKGDPYNARCFDLEPERYLFQNFINLSSLTVSGINSLQNNLPVFFPKLKTEISL